MDPKYLMRREVQEALLGLPDDTWLFELQRERKLRSACEDLVQLISDERTGLMQGQMIQALKELGRLLRKSRGRKDVVEEETNVHQDQQQQRLDAFVTEVQQAVARLISE